MEIFVKFPATNRFKTSGLQPDDPLNNDVFGGLLGGDGFGDEFGESVLPPLEELPPLADVSLDPIKEAAETKDGDTVEKMETDEVREEGTKPVQEVEESPELLGKTMRSVGTPK